MKLPGLHTTLFLACIPLLAGCNDPTSPRDELDDARRRWEARRIDTYSYNIVRYCECPPEFSRLASVMVVDDSVVSVRFVDDGTPVRAELLSTYGTIDRLFDVVERALQRKPSRLVVDYHPQFGYPSRVEIDYDARAADDEFTVRASDLIPVTELRFYP